MLFYFSATGNSKYVATQLKQSDEEMIDMAQALEKNVYHYQVTDRRVGIVSPTYDFALPAVVYEFLQKIQLEFQEKTYVFYVGTYGSMMGGAAALASNLLKKRNIVVDAQFDVKMPDTWTPIFDLSDSAQVEKTNAKAEDEIKIVCQLVEQRKVGQYAKTALPLAIGKIGTIFYEKYTRSTKRLSVDESLCIGCGLCAKKCPVQAIEIQKAKPVWVKNQCAMCLGCLHRCPTFAIQYGRGTTKKHGQYQHPKVEV